MDISKLIPTNYSFEEKNEIKKLIFFQQQNKTTLEKIKKMLDVYDDVVYNILENQLNINNKIIEDYYIKIVENNRIIKSIVDLYKSHSASDK